MNLAECPIDIILYIFGLINSHCLKNARLLNRHLHDILTPILFKCVRIEVSSTTPWTLEFLERMAGAAVDPIAEHATHLTIETSRGPLHQSAAGYIAQWLTRFTRVKSLKLEWDGGNVSVAEHRALQELFAASILQATENRLEHLTLFPSEDNFVPSPLLNVNGLLTLVTNDHKMVSTCFGSLFLRLHDMALPESAALESCGGACIGNLFIRDVQRLILRNKDSLRHLSTVHPCRLRGYKTSDIFSYPLRNLRTLTCRALLFRQNSVGDISIPMLAKSFVNLKHLELLDTASQALCSDNLWHALVAAETRLQTLIIDRPSNTLTDYLNSFSGLEKLVIDRIRSEDESIPSEPLLFALTRHGSSLRDLNLSYASSTFHVRGWELDPLLWRPIFPQMIALRNFRAHPPIFSSGPIDPRERIALAAYISQLKLELQAMLDAVACAPYLQVLWVLRPVFRRANTLGSMPRNKIQEIVGRAAPTLRVAESLYRKGMPCVEEVRIAGQEYMVIWKGEDYSDEGCYRLGLRGGEQVLETKRVQ